MRAFVWFDSCTGSPDMILVTAATGELGTFIIRKLLKRVAAHTVAVAVRNPDRAHHFKAAGVTVRRADYDEPAEAWVPALLGIDRVLLISSPDVDVEKRLAQHQHVIDAAAAIGVKLLAYTSVIGADAPGRSGLQAHYLTERAIERSGLPYAFLRNPFYTDAVLPKAFLQAAVDSGVLQSAAGTRSANSAIRADLADAAAAVLASDGHDRKAYDLTGPLWTFPQLASILTRIAGRPVELRDVSPARLGAAGWVHSLIADGLFERSTLHLEQLIGRRPADVDHYVRSTLGMSIVKDPVLRESA
jgi:NAD(P)H dehydrogenase (quinone)